MKTPIQKRGDQIIDKCHRERERVQEAFARFNAAAKHLQATLGHRSVATTSGYIHARPGDSSARFVGLGRFLPKSGEANLPFERAGGMDVRAVMEEHHGTIEP